MLLRLTPSFSLHFNVLFFSHAYWIHVKWIFTVNKLQFNFFFPMMTYKLVYLKYIAAQHSFTILCIAELGCSALAIKLFALFCYL